MLQAAFTTAARRRREGGGVGARTLRARVGDGGGGWVRNRSEPPCLDLVEGGAADSVGRRCRFEWRCRTSAILVGRMVFPAAPSNGDEVRGGEEGGWRWLGFVVALPSPERGATRERTYPRFPASIATTNSNLLSMYFDQVAKEEDALFNAPEHLVP
jgi:hypothetical protein